MNTVLTRFYTKDDVPYNLGEINRYLGVKEENSDIRRLINECISEAEDAFTYKVCYREFDLKFEDEFIDLGFDKVKSKKLEKNLFSCEKIILFSATVGAGIDRLIKRYSRISESKAVIFQAIGSERVESLCNLFNNEIKEEFSCKCCSLKPRFSPGYGDFDLECQRKIISVLDCPRAIGVTLNESLLMSPSKSVTALIGIFPSKNG